MSLISFSLKSQNSIVMSQQKFVIEQQTSSALRVLLNSRHWCALILNFLFSCDFWDSLLRHLVNDRNFARPIQYSIIINWYILKSSECIYSTTQWGLTPNSKAIWNMKNKDYHPFLKRNYLLSTKFSVVPASVDGIMGHMYYLPVDSPKTKIISIYCGINSHSPFQRGLLWCGDRFLPDRGECRYRFRQEDGSINWLEIFKTMAETKMNC